MNKGPLLINVIRRQNRKNFSADMEKRYIEVIKILLEHGASMFRPRTAHAHAHAQLATMLMCDVTGSC